MYHVLYWVVLMVYLLYTLMRSFRVHRSEMFNHAHIVSCSQQGKLLDSWREPCGNNIHRQAVNLRLQACYCVTKAAVARPEDIRNARECQLMSLVYPAREDVPAQQPMEAVCFIKMSGKRNPGDRKQLQTFARHVNWEE